jgi:type I restriction enzyme M protein
VVSHADLAANDWNLNIRRYADNAPPPEPQDVRAHLLGGVPKAEVAARAGLFAAHGLNPHDLFVERDAAYFDFAPSLMKRSQVAAAIEANAGLRGREGTLRDAFAAWWREQEALLIQLPETRNPMLLRANLLESFVAALAPVGLLDRFKVSGVIAIWWNAAQYDLKTLAEQGFADLVDGWVATLRTAMDPTDGDNTGARFDPTGHKLVTRLLPGYLDELTNAEAQRLELESRLTAATKADAEDEDAETDSDEETLSPEAIKTLKREITAARKTLQRLKADLLRRLDAARAALSADDCQRLVLDLAREDLTGYLDRYVSAHRQQVMEAFENWWDKYRVTLRDIEAERERTEGQLARYIAGLGYGQ